MRIIIDGTTICDIDGGRGAGIEHYTWSIIFSLARLAPQHEFIVYVPKGFPDRQLEELIAGCDNLRVVRRFAPSIPFFSQHVLFPLQVLLRRADLFFSPTATLPMLLRGKSVAVLHDMAIFKHPEWFPSGQGFSTQFVVPKSIKKATRLIAVSEATKRTALELFPEAEGKIDVVHEGVSVPSSISDMHAFEGAEDTVLFVGTIEPRKNLVHAVAAFFTFLRSHPERVRTTRFVLAGAWGWNAEEIAEAIDQTNDVLRKIVPEGVIREVGYVTEEEKWALLKDASVLFFPSLDEGFGLPALEAMSVGTPVIASDRGALPEITGDAAILVDPENIEQMSLALAQVLLVPEGAAQMVEAGMERAEEFSWKRAAKETLDIFDEILDLKTDL